MDAGQKQNKEKQTSAKQRLVGTGWQTKTETTGDGRKLILSLALIT